MKDKGVLESRDVWTMAVCTVLSIVIIVAFYRATAAPAAAPSGPSRRDATVATAPRARTTPNTQRDSLAESAPPDTGGDLIAGTVAQP